MIKEVILKEIENSTKIVIARHVRPDGDAVGSTLGLKRILSLTYPEKEIRVVNSDYSEYVSFLGKEDEEVFDYSDYLCIVIDTATTDRISNQNVLKSRKIIKIDHHIDVAPFGDISWVEDNCPSASEMIADFWFTFKDKLKIDLYAATCLYTGIVTDTGRFKYGKLTSKTMNLAGALLDFGIDTENLYAKLELEDFSFFKFQSYVFETMKISPSGVAYLYVNQAMQEKFNLSREQASESVDFMNSIKGSLIWMAFIDNPDKSIRVRVRSRFVPINELCNRYEGGGHANASGATVHSLEQMEKLVCDADEILKEYKKKHKDVL